MVAESELLAMPLAVPLFWLLLLLCELDELFAVEELLEELALPVDELPLPAVEPPAEPEALLLLAAEPPCEGALWPLAELPPIPCAPSAEPPIPEPSCPLPMLLEPGPPWLLCCMLP